MQPPARPNRLWRLVESPVFTTIVLAVILATGAHQYAHGVTDDIRLAWNRFPMIGLREDLVRAMQW